MIWSLIQSDHIDLFTFRFALRKCFTQYQVSTLRNKLSMTDYASNRPLSSAKVISLVFHLPQHKMVCSRTALVITGRKKSWYCIRHPLDVLWSRWYGCRTVSVLNDKPCFHAQVIVWTKAWRTLSDKKSDKMSSNLLMTHASLFMVCIQYFIRIFIK